MCLFKIRKFFICLITLLLLLSNSTVFTYAADSNGTSKAPNPAYVTIPVFDSLEEAERSLSDMPDYPVPLEAGGTELCIIKPFIVRNHGIKCSLYLNFDSTFCVNAVRFKELIVESEYIGKNFLKLTSDKYIT